MATHKLTQLVGALGAWLDAMPQGVADGDREKVSELILSGFLLGVATRDLEAPELEALTGDELKLLAQVRAWAFPDEDFADLNEQQSPIEDEPAQVVDADEPVVSSADPATIFQTLAMGSEGESQRDEAATERFLSEIRASTESEVAAAAPADLTQPEATVTSRAEPVAPEPVAPERSVQNEELFWWAVCAIAIVVLIVRRLL